MSKGISGRVTAHEVPLGRRPRLAMALFVVTGLTTTLAFGFGFSLAFLSILGAHELGHFVVARRQGVPVSPPYFLPLPPVGGLPGTLGAVIGISARHANRSQLAKVAVAGPISGFLVAVPVLVVALSLPGELARKEGDVFIFGHSLLVRLLEALTVGKPPPGFERLARPSFVGAWLGLFVTALNLLPLGQLDGGHLLHAIWPKASFLVSRTTFVGLAVLGGLGFAGVLPFFVPGAPTEWITMTRPLREVASPVYFIWSVLASLIGLRHPPIRDEHRPPDRTARILAIVAFFILVLVFVPNGAQLERFEPAASPR